jgi:hypothetical protein
MRHNLDLAVANLLDLHNIAEVAGAPVHLDAIVQELLKRRDVEDLVGRGLRGVDDELCLVSCRQGYR